MLALSTLGLWLYSASPPKPGASKFELPSVALPPEAAPSQGLRFTEVTRGAGIDFVHSIGDGKLDNLVEAVGSGGAFLDANLDGLLDLYILSMTFKTGVSRGDKPAAPTSGRFYLNRGDGRFEDATERAGLDVPMFSLGVTAGDFDGDGDPDLYVANDGPNRLFLNNGKGKFKDVSSKAGVGDPRCSTGAAFLDFDQDGLLDLYVANYVQYDPNYNYFYKPDVFPGPLAYQPQADALYRNLGNGRFEEVTAKAGMKGPASRGMGVCVADFNEDGAPDIFVANDAMANTLWLNDGKGHFSNQAVPWGVAYNHCGEGTAAMAGLPGDIDGDGLLDLFVPDNSFNALYCRMKKPVFFDRTNASGIAQLCGQYVTWASGLHDFDNDGDLDIFCVNGPLHYLWGQEDVYLENDGSGRFQDVSVQRGSYFSKKLCGRGACFGDYDNDGDVDAFIVNLNDRPVLLRNDSGNRNHFLEIRLEGVRSNRDGIGAIVEITAGGKKQVAQRTNAGYLSSSDPRLHFGTGQNATVDSVVVRWPSGAVQKSGPVPADQVLVIREPAEPTTAGGP